MSILILGANGSMGKRYQAILKYFRKPFLNADIDTSEEERLALTKRAGAVIIATPTDTHTKIIRDLIPYQKPILCEKPITKSVDELKELFREIEKNKIHFHMMYQYKNLVPKFSMGDSHYDYFRHGNDGLVWDCLQIIGLSRGIPTLREESPVWDCSINGHSMHIENMDEAYIRSVNAWIHMEKQDLGELLAAHQKTESMAHAK